MKSPRLLQHQVIFPLFLQRSLKYSVFKYVLTVPIALLLCCWFSNLKVQLQVLAFFFFPGEILWYWFCTKYYEGHVWGQEEKKTSVSLHGSERWSKTKENIKYPRQLWTTAWEILVIHSIYLKSKTVVARIRVNVWESGLVWKGQHWSLFRGLQLDATERAEFCRKLFCAYLNVREIELLCLKLRRGFHLSWTENISCLGSAACLDIFGCVFEA